MYTETLNDYLKSTGADLFGYADLRSFEPKSRAFLPFGISIGIALDAEVVGKIPRGPFMDYTEAYASVTARLDEIAEKTSAFIQSSGFAAVAQNREYVAEHSEGSPGSALMPHKTVAAKAGLGWITKSALIVTKEYGSAVRFTSVLTDAPVDAVDANYSCLCGDCRICADSCPTGAIFGNIWTPETGREQLFDYASCQRAHSERAKMLGVTMGGCCGVCIAVCPHTGRYLANAKTAPGK